MLTTELKYLWQMTLLAMLQAMVFNHLHLLGLATPVVTPLFLLFLPISEGRTTTLVRAFALGLLTDIIGGTPGLNSAALVATAMMRPGLLRLFVPREHDDDLVPSYRSMGTTKHLSLMASVVVVHHIVYFALESMNDLTLTTLPAALGLSIALSLAVMAMADTLRDRKKLRES